MKKIYTEKDLKEAFEAGQKRQFFLDHVFQDAPEPQSWKDFLEHKKSMVRHPGQPIRLWA